MGTITRALVQDALVYADLVDGEGVNVRDSYGGRGMYGRTCFGVDFDREADSYTFMVALTACLLGEDDDNGDVALDLAAAAATDSMGVGMVLYFPGWNLEG